MKTIKIAVMAAGLFFGGAAMAQPDSAKPENTVTVKMHATTCLDLMVNMALTSLHATDANPGSADSHKQAIGIQAGISFQAAVTSALSAVTELYFIQKGGTLRTGFPQEADATSIRLNAIELPVLARLHLGKLYLDAGPSLACNISGRRHTGDNSSKISFTADGKDFKRWEAGFQAGGGFIFPLQQKQLALDIRYAIGLTKLSYNNAIRNRALLISVHYTEPWRRNPLWVKRK